MNNLTFMLIWLGAGIALGLYFLPELWRAIALCFFLGALISCIVCDAVERMIREALK